MDYHENKSALNSENILGQLRQRMERVGKKHLALESVLPAILARLSDVISVDAKGVKVVEDAESSLEEIVTEFEVLKIIILDVLKPKTEKEKDLINETILYYLGMSAFKYSTDNSIQHEALEKELAEQLHLQERENLWFENVLNTLPVGILIVERNTGNLLFVNKAAKALAGGFYPMEILPDDQRDYYALDGEGQRIPRNELPRFRVARGDKLCGYELTIFYPGGKLTIVIHSDVIPATEGHPERIVMVFQEIEERKAREEIQKAEVEDLKEERSIRESFVSSLTHDLRTPLTIARMHAESISKRVEPSVLVKCRKVIKHIDEVDHMIQDLLDANKLKAGEKLPIEPCEMCMNDIIQNSVEDFRDLHGDRFIVKGPEKICGFWCGKAMRRMLDNLLGNAVKYGDPVTPVEIIVEQNEVQTSLKVHNYGHPISLKDQETLFEPFKRLKETEKNIKGWGIGLSLVKGLVEAHHGEINLVSNENQGTTFELRFPNRVPLTQ